MSQGDVWESSDVADAVGGAVGEGMHANQAFSVDTVVRLGLAFVQERPGLAIGGGALLFLSQFGPSVISIPINVAGQFVIIGGGIDPDIGGLVLQFIQISLTLMALPFQQLFMAGIVTAAAQHASGGEDLGPSVLYNGVGPAVRGLLYALMVGLIRGLVLSVIAIPVVGGAVGLAFALGAGSGSMDASIQGAVVGAVVAAVVMSFASLIVWLATVSLELGYYASVLDGAWPVEAVQRAWAAGRGATVTIAVTMFAMSFAMCMGVSSVYCLVGLVLVPVFQAVMFGGYSVAWLLHARPESTTSKWAFVQRNLPPSV